MYRGFSMYEFYFYDLFYFYESVFLFYFAKSIY